MRTTVNLDDDVVALVEKRRRDRALGLSEAVNALIRESLRAVPPRTDFRQRSQALGLSIDVSNVAEALEQLEGPSAR
jgi:Arc/MetJ family transcription regulator